MSFQTYTRAKSAQLGGRRVTLSLAVDCLRKDVSVLFLVGGRITPLTATLPRFWEVDTPAKAEAFLGRINLDALAEGVS